MTDTPPSDDAPVGRQPIPPGKRRRLQQSFAHGSRNSAKGQFDYANDMFTQCVVGDPTNLIYAQHLLGNLYKKYNNNKKGGKLATLKGAGNKVSIKKATGKKDWEGVFKAGCEMFKLNPWDVSTLLALAHACEELESDECQLFYLKSALDTNPKDAEVNRISALALTRMGEFDQAIACWHRVEQAKPGNEEAAKAIGNLTVEKTIAKGGYEEKATAAARGDDPKEQEEETGEQAPSEPEISPEEKLKTAIARSPEELSNYLDLAEMYSMEQRLEEAEELLSKAMEASGGGDLRVREMLEDVHLRRGQKKVEVAERRAQEEKTEEAVTLAKRMKAEVNLAELEIYSARSERLPENAGLRYELGLRLKRAGKFNEAIQSFQAARNDLKHKALTHLELGECFQHIKQYKLAMTNYEQAIEAAADHAEETKKLALYRAGKLAKGLKNLETAEKYLTELAGLDFGYKDVAGLLDKLAQLRDNA